MSPNEYLWNPHKIRANDQWVWHSEMHSWCSGVRDILVLQQMSLFKALVACLCLIHHAYTTHRHLCHTLMAAYRSICTQHIWIAVTCWRESKLLGESGLSLKLDERVVGVCDVEGAVQTGRDKSRREGLKSWPACHSSAPLPWRSACTKPAVCKRALEYATVIIKSWNGSLA